MGQDHSRELKYELAATVIWTLWQYGLWSFLWRTKSDRFLPKNQQTRENIEF
jgi:hypothetical protein